MYRKCYDVEKLKKYVNEGKSNVEIAYLLDISVATVIAGVKAYGLKGIGIVTFLDNVVFSFQCLIT